MRYYLKKLLGRSAVEILVALNLAGYLSLKIWYFFLTLVGAFHFRHKLLDIVSLHLYYADVLHRPWSLITYAIFNNSFLGLLLSIMIIRVFGKVIEQYLGKKATLYAYFISAVVASILLTILYNLLPGLMPYVFILRISGPHAPLMFFMAASCTLVGTYRIKLLHRTFDIKFLAVATFLLYALCVDMNSALYLLTFLSILLGFFSIRYLQRS